MKKRTQLLREVVELLMWELSAISNRKWEDLPELKKKKGLLADRLREYDWTPGPEDQEPLDLTMLKAQIADLEYQSRQKIQMQLQVIKGQLNALQGQKQYWLECLNIYFRKYTEPVHTL
ncbi:MAG TPA: flagellar protein FliT [Candidatus Methylacidiphilales bacterium]